MFFSIVSMCCCFGSLGLFRTFHAELTQKYRANTLPCSYSTSRHYPCPCLYLGSYPQNLQCLQLKLRTRKARFRELASWKLMLGATVKFGSQYICTKISSFRVWGREILRGGDGVFPMIAIVFMHDVYP